MEHPASAQRHRRGRVSAIAAFTLSLVLLGATLLITTRIPSRAEAITTTSAGGGGASYCFGQLLAAQTYADTATIINQSTELITQTIAVGAQPRSVAYSGNGHFAFVGDYGDQSITVIDTTTNTVLRVLQVGSGVLELKSNYDGSVLWAVLFGLSGDVVAKLAGTTGAVVASLQTNTNVSQLLLSPDEQTLWTLEFGSPNNLIVEYDAQTLTYVSGSTSTGYAYQGALSPDGSKLYLPDANGSGVVVFDTQLLTMTTIPSGFPLLNAAISPSGTKLYTVGIPASSYELYVLDLVTNTWTAGVDLATLAPSTYVVGMAISADGTKVYVSNLNYAAGGIYAVNTATPGTGTFIPTEIYSNVATCPLAVDPATVVTTVPSESPVVPNFTS